MRTLGDIGDKDTENEVLLLEHDIPHAKFSAEVLACLPQMPWTVSEEVRVCCVGKHAAHIVEILFQAFFAQDRWLSGVLARNLGRQVRD